MFIGEYSHSIDQKGRMAIPSKMRRQLGEGAVVTKGTDNCLFVYPKDEWQKLAQKLAALPISDAKARAFSRLMLAGANEVEFDGQGRALLPRYLREFASLNKKAIVAGLYNRLEIWEESAWEKYKQSAQRDQDKIADHLSQLGI